MFTKGYKLSVPVYTMYTIPETVQTHLTEILSHVGSKNRHPFSILLVFYRVVLLQGL